MELTTAQQEELDQLHLFMTSLRSREKQVLRLTTIAGLKYDTVASSLYISSQMVDKHIASIKRRFCKHFNLPEHNISFRYVQYRVYCYYFFYPEADYLPLPLSTR